MHLYLKGCSIHMKCKYRATSKPQGPRIVNRIGDMDIRREDDLRTTDSMRKVVLQNLEKEYISSGHDVA